MDFWEDQSIQTLGMAAIKDSLKECFQAKPEVFIIYLSWHSQVIFFSAVSGPTKHQNSEQ